MNYIESDEYYSTLKYSLKFSSILFENNIKNNNLNKKDNKDNKDNKNKKENKEIKESSVSSNIIITPEVDEIVKYQALEDVDYGAISCNLNECGPEKYYLTTAIAYTNGYPHMGHAYEFLTADALVRFHRAFGYDTYFLTGSDEHGQKVAASAEAGGRTPQEHCDHYVRGFKALNQRLRVSNSSYIRTTDEHHKLSAQKLWNMCASAGDIYLDTYEGWYNQREELFVTDSEAEATNFMDVGSGLPLKRVQEESYFFRMSKYGDWLINYIEENPEVIQPEQFRNNILTRLRSDPLKDLSVSRTSFSWGIPVPEGFDSKHVMYVWFDALSNYISGIKLLDENGSEYSNYWPAQVHLIGKDIVWFHSVIWPCMLKSAGIALPKQVFCHGFVNAADGRKMSKSYNNTIDPMDIINKYSSDTVRYYSVMATSYGSDLNFSLQSMIVMHNSELADILGNLVHRGLSLCLKYCDGVIPDTVHDTTFSLPFDFVELDREMRKDLSTSSLSVATFRAMEACRATNKFLTTAEPWKMKGEADSSRRAAIVRTTLEAIYIFSHYLAAIIPNAAGEIFKRLNTPPRPTKLLRADFYNLIPGTPITLGNILFTKIEDGSEIETPSTNNQKQSQNTKKSNENNKGKSEQKEKGKLNENQSNSGKKEEKDSTKQNVEKKEKKVKSTSNNNQNNQNEEGEIEQHDFTKIELRVGQIVNVWNHESAERLYCEEIDIGGEIRRIASGLREHYTLEEMQGRKLIVVCNLKEAKLVGFVSQGMVLASKSADGKVELVSPPEDAVVGERIYIEGVPNVDAYSSSRVKKYKVWENLFAPKLQTNSDCVATWDGLPLLTAAGRCYVPTITNSPIS